MPILTAQEFQIVPDSSRLPTMATTSRRAKRAKVSCCGRRCSSATVPCTYKASTDLKGQVPSDETHIVFAQAQTYSGIGQWQKASCCGPQVGKLILPQTLKYSQFTTYSLSYTFLYILIHSYTFLYILIYILILCMIDVY